jgi:hypothetical protein
MFIMEIVSIENKFYCYFLFFKIFTILVTYNYEQELKNIPQSIAGHEKIQKTIEATEKLLWDSFKSKHYFSERFNL